MYSIQSIHIPVHVAVAAVIIPNLLLALHLNVGHPKSCCVEVARPPEV